MHPDRDLYIHEYPNSTCLLLFPHFLSLIYWLDKNQILPRVTSIHYQLHEFRIRIAYKHIRSVTIYARLNPANNGVVYSDWYNIHHFYEADQLYVYLLSKEESDRDFPIGYE